MELERFQARLGVLALVILAAGRAAATDCNGNNVDDSQEFRVDCNLNGVPDECDLATGVSPDTNHSGLPDECEQGFVRGDPNADGRLSLSDAAGILSELFYGVALRGYCLKAADLNDDGNDRRFPDL